MEEVTKRPPRPTSLAAPEQSLLVDYLGDVQQSRQLGLPVFRLAGGAGFLWSASDRNGRGHLRFLAADLAVLAGTKDLPSPTTERAPAPAHEIAEPAAKGRAHASLQPRGRGCPCSGKGRHRVHSGKGPARIHGPATAGAAVRWAGPPMTTPDESRTLPPLPDGFPDPTLTMPESWMPNDWRERSGKKRGLHGLASRRKGPRTRERA
jgi:hypothetical protein